ncbi:MAG: signal peptidase I [Clostridia bacterium]|nr:signal peptidase I [Clostridia bacterium]
MWVHTNSMEPSIPEKSYILVEPVSAENVSVGDVITFHSDDPVLQGGLNTHRVIEIVGDHAEFVMKGDHNAVKDETTAKADKIVARYVRNLPVISVFGRFFMTPAGLVCALAVIAIFMFLLYLPDILKNRKKKAEEAERQKEAEMDRKIREEVEKMKQNADSGPENGSETGSENAQPRKE